MMLRVIHRTTYSYGETVSICHTEARLAPRGERGQTLFDHQLTVEPVPGSSIARKDYFGNAVTTFTIDQPHEVLRVTAQSLVETRANEAIHPALTPPWEQVREAVARHDTDDTFDALQFIFESPRVAPAPEFANYAKSSFAAERPLLQCAIDLCHRIFTDFKYDRDATTVTTPVAEAFHSREGVCQDFAHVMIACLRSRTAGALRQRISSHRRRRHRRPRLARVAVDLLPRLRMADIDPTNDVLPGTGHVTLGWGRDYSDVPPLKGVALGGADQVIAVEIQRHPRGTGRGSGIVPDPEKRPSAETACGLPRRTGTSMAPKYTIYALWVAWLVSWTIAMLWSGRTEKRGGIGAELIFRVLIWVSAVLLFVYPLPNGWARAQLWSAGSAVNWILAALTAAGLLFTWWARVHLGRLVGLGGEESGASCRG